MATLYMYLRISVPTMVDKIPWDTCVIALIVFVLKTEHCFPYQIALLSPPAPPPPFPRYNVETLEK